MTSYDPEDEGPT